MHDSPTLPSVPVTVAAAAETDARLAALTAERVRQTALLAELEAELAALPEDAAIPFDRDEADAASTPTAPPPATPHAFALRA